MYLSYKHCLLILHSMEAFCLLAPSPYRQSPNGLRFDSYRQGSWRFGSDVTFCSSGMQVLELDKLQLLCYGSTISDISSQFPPNNHVRILSELRDQQLYEDSGMYKSRGPHIIFWYQISLSQLFSDSGCASVTTSPTLLVPLIPSSHQVPTRS
jgi:hypothetical protein